MNIRFGHLNSMEAKFINVRDVRVMVVYRSPSYRLSSEFFLDEFSTLLEELIVCYVQLLIMADFNLHIEDTEMVFALMLSWARLV